MSARVECDECGEVRADRPAGTECTHSQCNGTMREQLAQQPRDPFGILIAAAGSGRTVHTLDQETADAHALVPVAKEIAAYVREKLPAGVDFAVFVRLPGANKVMAITSHRERMCRAISYWVMETLDALRGVGNPRREIMVDDSVFFDVRRS